MIFKVGDRVEFDWTRWDSTVDHVVGPVTRVGLADWLTPHIPFYDVADEAMGAHARAWHVDAVTAATSAPAGMLW